MKNVGNGRLENQVPILDSQIIVEPTKMILIPLLILSSKRRNHSNSELSFLNSSSKRSLRLDALTSTSIVVTRTTVVRP